MRIKGVDYEALLNGVASFNDHLIDVYGGSP